MLSTIPSTGLSKPFWVIWAIEIWERFGYYGTQALLALFFINHLGYSESESMYLFGSFISFVYGFIWVGGQIGDKVLGAKRTLILGAIILMLSYISLFFSTPSTIFYSLAGIIVGNTLFKANPSSLVSKLYKQGDPMLDGAMTMYYMAINTGSVFALFLTPIIAEVFGFKYAFLMSGIGIVLGLLNFFIFYKLLDPIGTEAGRAPLRVIRLTIVIAGAIFGIFIIGIILPYTAICYTIVGIVAFLGFAQFLKITFSLYGSERKRMFVAFILILQGIVFFVLYTQMPTTLTFLAKNNINSTIFGWVIPAAQYQILNPIFILLMSPLLTWIYKKFPGSHVTKFCLGMTLCAFAFLVLWLPQFFTVNGFISPLWMIVTYWFQATGELLISALGIAMVAELCPEGISGFVMGIWFITTMVAGPISAWIGAMTTPDNNVTYTAIESIHIYGKVFGVIGLVVAGIAIIMWFFRPFLVKLINNREPFSEHSIDFEEGVLPVFMTTHKTMVLKKIIRVIKLKLNYVGRSYLASVSHLLIYALSTDPRAKIYRMAVIESENNEEERETSNSN